VPDRPNYPFPPSSCLGHAHISPWACPQCRPNYVLRAQLRGQSRRPRMLKPLRPCYVAATTCWPAAGKLRADAWYRRHSESPTRFTGLPSACSGYIHECSVGAKRIEDNGGFRGHWLHCLLAPSTIRLFLVPIVPAMCPTQTSDIVMLRSARLSCDNPAAPPPPSVLLGSPTSHLSGCLAAHFRFMSPAHFLICLSQQAVIQYRRESPAPNVASAIGSDFTCLVPRRSTTGELIAGLHQRAVT